MSIHIYTPNCDAFCERSLRTGAISLMPPKDEPFGDRAGDVTDPFGNRWFVAAHFKDVTP
jgi:PhnB protein